ncbi:MAG: 23S rRNA (adenine(2030)-N(6))-methyltransferase RlmJ [Gammaproteobacteria bacterium]|nr:23S rRNA (adenine(2030)-N(6))-methyltransferase RlmJ [Gammaproteobacteria bacterium]
MNYRHNYHAGNAADVFKHVVLTLVLRALHKKDTPFFVLDTHAGSGAYTLERPGEFEAGIGVVWAEREQWPVLTGYFTVVEKINGQGGIKYYPGSPFIIREYLRPQDRAVFMEQQPGEYLNLKTNFSGASNIGVHHADAWSALKAFVPPRENRGVVLIDPPFETANEFDNVVAALRHGARHWRNGIYLAWYPVKSRTVANKLYQALRMLDIEAQALEFMLHPDDVENRLNGSGMVLVNAPWGVMDALREILPPLAERLAGAEGRPEVRDIDLRGDYAA